jgi:hypothetical protein
VNEAIALLIHQRRRTLHRTTLATAPAAWPATEQAAG